MIKDFSEGSRQIRHGRKLKACEEYVPFLLTINTEFHHNPPHIDVCNSKYGLLVCVTGSLNEAFEAYETWVSDRKEALERFSVRQYRENGGRIICQH